MPCGTCFVLVEAFASCESSLLNIAWPGSGACVDCLAASFLLHISSVISAHELMDAFLEILEPGACHQFNNGLAGCPHLDVGFSLVLLDQELWNRIWISMISLSCMDACVGMPRQPL